MYERHFMSRASDVRVLTIPQAGGISSDELCVETTKLQNYTTRLWAIGIFQELQDCKKGMKERPRGERKREWNGEDRNEGIKGNKQNDSDAMTWNTQRDKWENTMHEMLMHAKWCSWRIERKWHILLVIGHYSSYFWPSSKKDLA